MKKQRLRAKDLHTGRVVYMVVGGTVEKMTVVCKGRTRFVEKKLKLPHGSMTELHRTRVLFSRMDKPHMLMDLCMCKGDSMCYLFAKEKQAIRCSEYLRSWPYC